MRNLAELICDRVQRRPGGRFGMAGEATPTLGQAVGTGTGRDRSTGRCGRGPGPAGCAYRHDLGLVPDDLAGPGAGRGRSRPGQPRLSRRAAGRDAGAARAGRGRLVGARAHGPSVAPEARSISTPPEWTGETSLNAGSSSTRQCITAAGATDGLDRLSDAPGLGRDRFDVAGWMHTSGTTGVPKFCEQTHEYFLRLGRFIADSMCFSETDTVLAPLPHVPHQPARLRGDRRADRRHRGAGPRTVLGERVLAAGARHRQRPC